MKARRTKILLSLAVLLLTWMLGDVVLCANYIDKKRLAVESLVEGMTIDEAASALDRELRSDFCFVFQSSLLSQIYLYDTEWWIWPRYEFELRFMDGRLSGTGCKKVPISDTWQKLKYHCKKRLGL